MRILEHAPRRTLFYETHTASVQKLECREFGSLPHTDCSSASNKSMTQGWTQLSKVHEVSGFLKWETQKNPEFSFQ